jgi:hypothetical protein
MTKTYWTWGRMMKRLEDEKNQHLFEFAVSFRRINEMRDAHFQSVADKLKFSLMTVAQLEAIPDKSDNLVALLREKKIRNAKEIRVARTSIQSFQPWPRRSKGNRIARVF